MGSQQPLQARWVLLVVALGLLCIPLLGGAGVGIVDAQANESNNTSTGAADDDGFGATPGEDNITVEFGDGVADAGSDNVSVGDSGEDGSESEADEGDDGPSSIGETLVNRRDEVTSSVRDFSEDNVPGAERIGEVYDMAQTAEDTMTGGADFVQSPGEYLFSMGVFAVTALLAELIALINVLHEFAIQVPAPGQATDPTTWTTPESGFWQTVYSVISWPLVIGIIWLIAQFCISFSYNSAEKRRRAWKRAAFAGLMIFGTFTFFPGLLHLFAELANDIYPDGQEFLSIEGSVQFGLGVFVLLGLLIFKGTVVVAALVAVIAMNFLTYLVGVFWPLMWAAWASHGQARAYGSFGLFIFGSLLALSAVQSIILRFLLELPLGESIGGTAGSIVLITFGVGFTLVWLPWKFLQKAQLASAVMLGKEPAQNAWKGSKQVPAQVSRITNRFHSDGSGQQQTLDQYSNGGWKSGVRSRIPSIRSGGSSTGGGSTTTSSGSDSSTSASSGSSGTSGSAGSSSSSVGATSQSTQNSGSGASPVSSSSGDQQQSFDDMEKDRVERIVNS